MIDSFVDFDAWALQFHLDKRQSVDKYGHIIATFVKHIVLVGLIHGDLMCHLIGVPGFIVCEKAQVDRLTVVQVEDPLLSKNFGGLINRVILQPEKNSGELGVGKFCGALRFHQIFSIDFAKLCSEVIHNVIVVRHRDEVISHFSQFFNKNGFNFIFRGYLCHIAQLLKNLMPNLCT